MRGFEGVVEQAVGADERGLAEGAALAAQPRCWLPTPSVRAHGGGPDCRRTKMRTWGDGGSTMMRRILWVLLAACSWSCGQDRTPVACPAYAAAGLSVDVTNAATAQPICDATVTVTESGYSERLFETSCMFVGAYERPGTYVVRAARPGFIPNEVGSVRVVMSAEQCPHVQQVRVAIPLTPEG